MYVASNPHDSLPVTLTTEPMAVGLFTMFLKTLECVPHVDQNTILLL